MEVIINQHRGFGKNFVVRTMIMAKVKEYIMQGNRAPNAILVSRNIHKKLLTESNQFMFNNDLSANKYEGMDIIIVDSLNDTLSVAYII